MTLSPRRIGDHGQRYEILYQERDSEKVLKFGWCDTRDAAQQMADAWGEHPNVEKAWFVDRKPEAGADPIPNDMIATILQGRLNAFVGRPMDDDLRCQITECVEGFCRDFGFPRLVVVCLPNNSVELFEAFQNWADVDQAITFCLMKHQDTLTRDQALAAFQAHLNQFPVGRA
jgi:hypothetical protein